MKFDLPPLRIALYFALGLFSFILFCLSAARLHYTTHLFPDDPLNHGTPFYDPIVVEIIFTTLITIPWCIFIIVCIHRRVESKFISTFRGELIGLGVLWLFWIIGASTASDVWGDLSWCSQFEACRVLSALIAFSWLGWIVLTIILAISMLFTFANKAFKEPLHGRWDPRTSSYYNA